MSMISELVRILKSYAMQFEADGWKRTAEVMREAYTTIEELSAKLAAANMARSTACYNGGWIPCSEKLPETGTTVLATIWHKRWIADYDSGNKEWWTEHPEYYEVCTVYRDGNEYIKIDDADHGNITYVPVVAQEDNLAYPIEVVLAWMPLPEPYKGG